MLTPREQRFFFLPIFLQRWDGYAFAITLIHSPIAITMIVQPSHVTSILKQIELLNLPSRVLLTLYLPLRPSRDCIITCQADKCQRKKETIFPLNRLRNISLRRVNTTHFLLIDMDSWPSRNSSLFLPRRNDLRSPSLSPAGVPCLPLRCHHCSLVHVSFQLLT